MKKEKRVMSRDELESINRDLLRILVRRKDASAGATIKELTDLVLELRHEVTELRVVADNLKGKNQALVEQLVKSDDDLADTKEALDLLVVK